jgi:hypothetical protein
MFHQHGAPAGKALGDMLAVNTSLQDLDVSSNGEDCYSKGGPSFAHALSVGISDNGALLCDNGKHYHGWSLNPEYAANPEGEYKYITTARDVDDQDEVPGELGVCQHCGKTMGQHQEVKVKGALTSLDISDNSIVSETWIDPPQQGLTVGDLVDGKCISSIDEEDGKIHLLELSGIKALADVIPDMRALTCLNLASNSLCVEGAKMIAACLPECT